MIKLEIGKWYYYAKCKRKMLCVCKNVGHGNDESVFIDKKYGIYQFYNFDMRNIKYKKYNKSIE